MDALETMLSVLSRDPADDMARLALADCLEEAGYSLRAELVRYLAWIRLEPDSRLRRSWEEQARQLLIQGVNPCTTSVRNSIGMTFVLIPPGTFWMGSPNDEDGRFNDEGPVRPVRLTQAFYLSAYPVTQEQYCRVIGSNPSCFTPGGDAEDLVRGLDTTTFPVDSVSWDEANAFCLALGERSTEREAQRHYRLPTEAEWEYACRGGILSSTPYHVGEVLRPEHARYDFRSDADVLSQPSRSSVQYVPRPAPVGSYRPNGWGLYDMHGNVWEWCADRFSESYYRRGTTIDPTGPKRGSYRVLRGGSWFSRASVCRSACRNPVATPSTTGFRIVLQLGT